MIAISLEHFKRKFIKNGLPVWKAYSDKALKKQLEHNYEEKDVESAWQLFEDFAEMYPDGNTVYVVTKTAKTANDDNVVAVKWGNGGSSIGSSRGSQNSNNVQKANIDLVALMMQQNNQNNTRFDVLQAEMKVREDRLKDKIDDLKQENTELKYEVKSLQEENAALRETPAGDPFVDAIAGQMPMIVKGIFGTKQHGIAGTIGQRTAPAVQSTQPEIMPEPESKFTPTDAPPSCDRFLGAAAKMKELWPNKHPNDIIELLVIYAQNPANKIMADTVIGQLYNV